jgi:hypothetical protein
MFFLGLVGCSATRFTPIAFEGGGTRTTSYQQLRVLLASGEQYDLFNVIVTPDSVRGELADAWGGSAPREVSQVVFGREVITAIMVPARSDEEWQDRGNGRDHGRGALKGLWIGALSGAGLGLLVGSLVDVCDPTEEVGWFRCFMQPTSRGDAIGYGILAGTLLGGFSGLVIGAIAGTQPTEQTLLTSPTPPARPLYMPGGRGSNLTRGVPDADGASFGGAIEE